MRARTRAEMRSVGPSFPSGWSQGVLDAVTLVDEMYSSCSTHRYLLGDCVLAKLNLLLPGKRVRINPRRIKV